MNKRKTLLYTSVSLLITSILYTIIIKTVDVKIIGPNGTSVGLAGINSFFHNMFGLNRGWYKITKYLGIIPFLIVAFYGLIGLKQLINRKSIKKVDKRLLLLGGFYILVGLTYVFFEKVIINYRPVILEGQLEASYPSSHTMLAVCICTSSLLMSKYYIKNKKSKNIIDKCTIVLMIALVIGRILSGVHWITDIIGGIIISLFLVSILYYFISNPKLKNKGSSI